MGAVKWLEKHYAVTDQSEALIAADRCRYEGCREAIVDTQEAVDGWRLRVVPASWSMKHKLVAVMGEGVEERS